MATSLALVAPISTNRDALAGGLAFLEGTSSLTWGVGDLCAWFKEHLVDPGCMPTPLVVTEPSAGTLPLYGRPPASSQDVRKILVAARSRVLTALRGLTASPADDRFLTASIFSGRVSRQQVHGAPRWVARPEPTTPLSGVVLSLFAVDVLSNRDFYDHRLSVCETCNRVTFHAGARWACRDHASQWSGVFRKVTGESHE